MNSEPAREDDTGAWLLNASVSDVASTLPSNYNHTDVEIGLAHILAADMQYNGGRDDNVAIRLTIAETDGRNPLTFHGEIQRREVQKFLDLFRENVENFRIGRTRPLRVVDDGQA